MWTKEAVALKKKDNLEYVLIPKGTECIIVGGQYLNTKYGLLELTSEAIMNAGKYFSSDKPKEVTPQQDLNQTLQGEKD